MKSANARVNINHKALNDKLKLNMNISYGETNSDQAPVSNTVGSEMGSSMLYEAYVLIRLTLFTMKMVIIMTCLHIV